jgi:hypothetical protein
LVESNFLKLAFCKRRGIRGTLRMKGNLILFRFRNFIKNSPFAGGEGSNGLKLGENLRFSRGSERTRWDLNPRPTAIFCFD